MRFVNFADIKMSKQNFVANRQKFTNFILVNAEWIAVKNATNRLSIS